MAKKKSKSKVSPSVSPKVDNGPNKQQRSVGPRLNFMGVDTSDTAVTAGKDSYGIYYREKGDPKDFWQWADTVDSLERAKKLVADFVANGIKEDSHAVYIIVQIGVIAAWEATYQEPVAPPIHFKPL